MDFETPEDAQVDRFYQIIAASGLLCTVRRHHGREIGGACGQLALNNPSASEESRGTTRVKDIEDMMSGGVTRRAGAPPNPAARRRVRVRDGAEAGGSAAAEEDGPSTPFSGGLSVKAMQPAITCARFTWLLSCVGMGVAVLALLVVKTGVTAYIMERTS